MLNQIIRPFTAKWHLRKLAGDLARDDATREFRGELIALRGRLEQLASLLYVIATGHKPLRLSVPSDPDRETRASAPIPFDCLLGLPDDQELHASLPKDVKWRDQVAAILHQEQQEIENRREAVRSQARPEERDTLPEGCDDLVGLAVSGGGIRSATFALGVVQGLTDRGILRQVDLLSTVSGGGYLGAFLSSMLNTESKTEETNKNRKTAPVCGPDRERPPFKRNTARDSLAIRELRNNSRYIVPATTGRWLLTVGQAAYGVVSNLIILSVLVFVAVLLTDAYEFWTGTLSTLYERVRAEPAGPTTEVLAMWWPTAALWVASVSVLFFLPLVQRIGRLGPGRAKFCRFWEWGTVVAFAVALTATVIEYLPLAHYGYLSLVHAISDTLSGDGGAGSASGPDGWSLQATLVTLINAVAFIAARAAWLWEKAWSFPRLRKVLFALMWMAGPALFVFAYFELCRVYVADGPAGGLFPLGSCDVTVPWLLLVLSLGYSALINVNFTSLHRYYRNRLAATWLLRQHSETAVKSTEKSPRAQQLLSDMRLTSRSTAPYHLINATLNLPSSDEAELRGRDCDFFLFSKYYCGSRVLGYQPTQRWENEDPHLDLGTAVAISGAAAAPQMGMGSIRGASFLLTLLNVRLGYWLRRPESRCPQLQEADQKRSPRLLAAPGPWYLLRETFNWMNHKSAYVNVSDGGHLENLGLYELLRRRCKYMIAIDGECDPHLDCPSLMRLKHFAYVDLGVDIRMDVERLKWVEVIPADDEPSDDEQAADAIVRSVMKRTRYTRGHFAVGEIRYPSKDSSDGDEGGDSLTGWLIYVKLSITGNEPAYVLDYRRRFPDFPHQSTGDQVFEDDQFEAYRRLGEHAADDLFADEILSEQSVQQAKNATLPIRDWYRDITASYIRKAASD